MNDKKDFLLAYNASFCNHKILIINEDAKIKAMNKTPKWRSKKAKGGKTKKTYLIIYQIYTRLFI